MKSWIVLIAFLCAASPAFAQGLTKAERDRAINELQNSRKLFLASIDGLSEAQWNFKPAPEVWSVAEAAEHITVSEETLLGLVTEKIMKSPAQPEKRPEVRGKDNLILERMVDRSRKAQAPEFLRPTHRWATQQELVDHFKASRDHTVAYIDHTEEALRDHFFEHPAFGLLDGYQWVLLISAHSRRHTMQIEEVKANAAFPKP